MCQKLQRLTCVDDEPDVQLIIQFVLQEIGDYEVDSCSSGAEAIERAPEFKPDLVLLDVMMPEMDGIETFKRLSAMPELDGIPIVFMTAKAMQHEWEQYCSMGVADVIAKPFDPMELSDRIQAIWRTHHKMRESAA